MLDLTKKATMTTLSAITLVCGLAAQAQAMNATPLSQGLSLQTQQTPNENAILFESTSPLQTDIFLKFDQNGGGLNPLKSNNRDYVRPNLNARIFNNGHSNTRRNLTAPGFGSTVSSHNNFGTYGLGNSRFGHDTYPQTAVPKRDLTRSGSFKSHINANRNFRDATILRGRF